MEDALALLKTTSQIATSFQVLILVVMEDALARIAYNQKVGDTIVLILVVMEDALAQDLKPQWCTAEES